jgi:hypothetical protein
MRPPSERTRRRAWPFVLPMLMSCATPSQPPVQDPLLGVSVQQAVVVETPGCSPVSCELVNDKGTWTVPATPGTVTLTTLRQPLNVSCRADSGALAGVASPSSRQAASGKGALAGGALGGGAMGAAIGGAGLAFIPALGVIAIVTAVGVGAVAGQTA